jgi:hypothetical protein
LARLCGCPSFKLVEKEKIAIDIAIDLDDLLYSETAGPTVNKQFDCTK